MKLVKNRLVGFFNLIRIIGAIRAGFESAAFRLLNRSRNFFIIPLNKNFELDSTYSLYQDYGDELEYRTIQKAKTSARLAEYSAVGRSQLWSSKGNLKFVSRLIRKYLNSGRVSGACMGTRTGEEQHLLGRYLGVTSNVIGVELDENAREMPNTVIADFHNLPSNMRGRFDFVYSNSHDQSNRPRKAFEEWVKVLRPGGLLILEHSRSHGKSHSNFQDPFGAETEIMPFLLMSWLPGKLVLAGIHTPPDLYDGAHRVLVFRRV